MLRSASADRRADRARALAALAVSRETEQALDLYVDLLDRWQPIKNLVGPGTLPEVWTRHIADSAQLLPLAHDARRWLDIGSGAGFPGLVLAILMKDREGATVDLVEANGRKCAFLREVARATGAPARVHAGRIESVLPTLAPGIEIVSARALAPLDALLAMVGTVISSGATGLFLKGEREAAPVDNPASRIDQDRFEIESRPSVTHSNGRIIVVRAKLHPDGSMTTRESHS